MSKKGLGRGLGALLPEIKENEGDKVSEISVDLIVENPFQPRREFDEEKLRELALSIKEHGVVQPILVRPSERGKYELVAGERRWRATRMLGIEKIPAIIRELSERETSEIALIENIQREDLNSIEEALAYQALMDEHGLTQEEVSRKVGKSRSVIANTLRLLALPSPVKEMVVKGELSAGHARTILSIGQGEKILDIAKKVVSKGLSVRQTEALVRNLVEEKRGPEPLSPKTDPILAEIEEKLRAKLSTKVSVSKNNKKGFIEIEYYSDEDLQRILESILGEIEM